MAERAFWGLLNPTIGKTISRETVNEFLNELAWIAINLPLSFFEHECEHKEKMQKYNFKFDDDEDK